MSLVEMIVAIVVGGILVALTGMFVSGQIRAYSDVSNRAALADDADTATRRIAREIAGALPNSVRVHSTGCCLEFIQIRDGGRYRSEIGLSGPAVDRALDFGATATASEFDVLGPPVQVVSGDRVVIYNLGQPGADAYAGDNIRAPNTFGASLSRIGAASAFQFPLASPSHRFHIVSGPVSYVCGGGELRRYWGYAINPVQSSAPGGSSALLAGNVASCSFEYTPAVLQRNGMVSIRLRLARNDESVDLQQQVDVNNTP